MSPFHGLILLGIGALALIGVTKRDKKDTRESAQSTNEPPAPGQPPETPGATPAQAAKTQKTAQEKLLETLDDGDKDALPTVDNLVNPDEGE